MKDERVSLGLQPGSGTDAAFERPGTFSKRSWQPMSLTSNVPGGGSTQTDERGGGVRPVSDDGGGGSDL